MNASVGDVLHVHAHTVGRANRTGEIVEVRGPDGSPPYLVRFSDGHETLIFPGADSTIEPKTGHPVADTGGTAG